MLLDLTYLRKGDRKPEESKPSKSEGGKASKSKAAKGEKRPGEKAKSEPAAKKTRNSLLASSFHVFQSKGTGVILRGSYQED